LGSMNILTIRDVFPQRDIYWVTSSCPIETAVDILSQKNILSLPVLDESKTKVIGIVDVLDIATFVVAKFPQLEAITPETLKTLEYNGVNFGKTPLSQIVDSKPLRFFVKIEDPLSKLLDILAQGTHRIPIVNQEGSQVLNFISQSDVVRFFAEHLYLLQNKGSSTLASCRTEMDSKVSFIRSDVSVIMALSFMTTNKLSAVAVVNESGELVANFSASDLRGVKISNFELFLQPVNTFLLNWQPRSLHPITISMEDTIESTICKLVATKKHRLWIIDPKLWKLTGVVSLTDVCRWIAQLGSSESMLSK